MSERLSNLALSLLLLSPFSALTSSQKRWVRARDDDKCQAPFPHQCGGTKEGQHDPIHHILGQRYLYSLGVDPDYPENVLEICQNAHDVIHPDVPVARRNFHKAKEQGKDSFQEMFDEREKKLKQRQVPWNDQYDRPLQVRAVKNTQRYLREHPDDQFPK